MTAIACAFCSKLNEGMNYCNWDCHVALARKKGGKEICPNGLPVSCVRADGTMMEHEHADHPDYKFPVKAILTSKPLDEWENTVESHALIYQDFYIAVTMYEQCYALWTLRDGKCLGGNLWKKGEWQLVEESLEKIRGLREL